MSDLSPDALSLGLSTVGSLLTKASNRGILSSLSARQAMDRITPVCEPVPIREGDLVIEAIVERIGAKRTLLADLDSRAPVNVPIATNTSALSIDCMGVAMDNPSRLGGLHFFNPVHRMELVEVIHGRKPIRNYPLPAQFCKPDWETSGSMQGLTGISGQPYPCPLPRGSRHPLGGGK